MFYLATPIWALTIFEELWVAVNTKVPTSGIDSIQRIVWPFLGEPLIVRVFLDS